MDIETIYYIETTICNIKIKDNDVSIACRLL
jgi:hypothetical protein